MLGFPLLNRRLLLIRLFMQNLCIVFNCRGRDIGSGILLSRVVRVWRSGVRCSACLRCVPGQAPSLSGDGRAVWS